MSYAARLGALTQGGPVLCVGIDPHPALLTAWGEADTPAGLGSWARRVREALSGAGVSVWKPQVALFERHGVAGMAVLAELLGELRTSGALVIGDAKRGDIGSTMEGYADAWLGAGSDFEVDAVTLVAYQGVGALQPALRRAVENSKGVFILSATSNAEAWATQRATRADGLSAAQGVVTDLAQWVDDNCPDSPESFGVVVGATVDQVSLGLRLAEHPTMPILAPGYGAQGAELRDVRVHFPHSRHVLPVSARALLEGGEGAAAERVASAQREVSPR